MDSNQIQEIKKQISSVTSIPIELLRGESIEEDIATAKALLAYKKERQGSQGATAKEKFISCYAAGDIEQQYNAKIDRLIEIEDKVNGKTAPIIMDGGETKITHTKTPREAFSEWIRENGKGYSYI